MDWVGFGVPPLGSLIIIAGMTIGAFVLGWWFYMPNPMDKDKKNRKKP
jgi:heme/copper-type cytochrome/quinol oxidase subunit 1